MAVLRAQVETERPGIVTVRAICPAGKEGDARPVCGFFVRRRYPGDTFQINDWTEFSPVWMEFIDEPPAGWREKIDVKYKERKIAVAKAEAEDQLSPRERMQRDVFSMAELQKNQAELVINQATGAVKPRPTLGLQK